MKFFVDTKRSQISIPFQFMTCYLYREMGWPAVYGALTVVAVVPFQSNHLKENVWFSYK